MKKIFFFIILAIPLVALVVFLSLFAVGIYRIRCIDYDKIYADLKAYLEKEKGSFSLEIKNDNLCINYDYYIPNGPYKRPYRKIRFTPKADDYVIYVYGSSVVFSNPPLVKEAFAHFPEVLEEKIESYIKKDIKIYNFGMEGHDTFEIKKLVKETIKIRKPNLIIYFDIGSGIFENAYFSCVQKNYYFFWNYLLRKPRLPQALQIRADYYFRAYLEPSLINFAQKMNLIHIPYEAIKKYNNLILSFEKKNIYDIIQLAQSNNVPLVIATHVGNLEERPYGIYDITEANYQKGMQETDYLKKIEYLIAARDAEIFSYYFGFKPCVYEFLTNIKKENVYVFDFKKKLQNERFEFSYKNFYDYSHLKKEGHQLGGTLLFGLLKKNKLIN